MDAEAGWGRAAAAAALSALVLCGGCTPPRGSASANDARVTDESSFYAPPYPFHQVERERPPELAEQVLSARAFEVSRACTQGPLEFDLPAAEASYARYFGLWLCSPTPVAGRARFEVDGDLIEERNFGPDRMRPPERCVASSTELREGGGGTASRPADGAAPGSAPSVPALVVPPGSAPPGSAPDLLSERPWDPSQMQCATEYQLPLGQLGSYTSGAFEPARFRVRVWFDSPMHLEGAVFVAWQAGLSASVDAAAWARHYAFLQASWEAARASGDVRVEAEWERVGTRRATDHGVPPPPRVEVRTPRASVNAVWVDGYWRWVGEAWAWFDGFWRVPPSDLEARLTVEAPIAPPTAPAAVEVTPVKPVPEAVWAAGHWEWNGAAYVWVTGSWRLPPAEGGVWIEPSWERLEGRFVFMPGRWTIRVGR